MRSKQEFIQERRGTNLGDGTDVLVEWNEWPAGSAVRDGVTNELAPSGGDSGGGVTAPLARRAVVSALVHFPEPTVNAEIRQFNEVEAGNMILDLDPSTPLDGRDGLTFTLLQEDGTPVDGIKWVPKPTSDRLARVWGTMMHGKQVWRTVLLRKQT